MFRKVVFCISAGLFFLFLGLDCAGQGAELREGYYPDGKLRYKGYFTGTEPTGEVTHYYADGKVKAVMNHRGDRTEAVIYSKDGLFSTQGVYQRRKKDGVWLYKKGERVMARETYRNDRLEGMTEKYDSTGKVLEASSWKEGLLFGRRRVYYPSGKLHFEIYFADGKPDGPARVYSQEGELAAEGNYKDGLRDGLWRYFDGNGKVKKSYTFRDGRSAELEAEELEAGRELDEWLNSDRKLADPADFTDQPEMYLKIAGD